MPVTEVSELAAAIAAPGARLCPAILLFSLWMIAWGGAHADEAAGIVKYRQNVMLSMRWHFAAAKAITDGKVGFRHHLLDHARALEASVDYIPQLFPDGSNQDDTKALEPVWSRRAEFLERAGKARDKARQLGETVATGDHEQAGLRLKELLDACKACHKDFRRKEE